MFSARWLLTYRKPIRVDLGWDGDVADAFTLALRYDRSDAFNLAGAPPMTMDEIGRILGKRVIRFDDRIAVPLAGVLSAFGFLSKADVEWLRSAARGNILMKAARAKELLGWSPSFDNKEVLLRAFGSVGRGGS